MPLPQHLIRSRRDRLLLVSDDRVRARIADNGVATATMLRADKHNALDQAMVEGLVDAAEQLAGDTSAALARESVLQTGLIGMPNQIAAVVAGMSWEQPVFASPA